MSEQRIIAVAFVLVWVGAACSSDVDSGRDGAVDLGPPMIELVNQGTGDDRPLEQAMLHSQLGNYGGATNLLAEPLAPGERVEIREIDRGSYHLTVIRRPRSWGTERIALTTASAMSVDGGRYLVWVFDESFRIHAPTANHGGPSDLSIDAPGDAGAEGPPEAGPDADTGVSDGSADVGPSDAAVDGAADGAADGAVDGAVDGAADGTVDAPSDV